MESKTNRQTKTKIELIDTENRLVLTRGRLVGDVVGKMCEDGQKVQTFSYKIKVMECNI